jgi:hypothetical protein
VARTAQAGPKKAGNARQTVLGPRTRIHQSKKKKNKPR